MISLLRWGFGTGHEHLTEKERITATEKRNAHASAAMVPSQVKRKRGDSTKSLTPHAPHRPTKRGAPIVNMRGDGRSVSEADGMNGAAPSSKGVIAQSNGTVLAQQIDGVVHESNMLVEPMNLDLDSATPTDVASIPTIPSKQPDLAASLDDTTVTAQPMPSLSDAQQVISEQFSMEILLKHNELRLIDQEIGKCQVALEQLRRCSIVPYPSNGAGVKGMLDVASGTGLPLRPANGHRAPKHPAPWGVTDGPYSRHYSRWLLPDPEFDGGYVEEIPSSARGKVSLDRRQRASFLDQSSRLQTSRGRRGSAGSRLQALSSGYPPPKEDKGHAIVTRQSDKKLVKLVCPDCNREDFNSAQGFINHCRIAHSRQFASHEVAAQTVGVEIDAPPPTTDNPTPITAPVSAARLEITTPVQQSTNGNVNPLLRPGQLNIPTLSTPFPRRSSPLPRKNGTSSNDVTPPAHRAPVPDDHSDIPFKPSAKTPHLSKIFELSGRGGDLNEFVTEATHKEDLDAMESDDDSASGSNFGDSDIAPHAAPHNVRVPRSSLCGGPANKSPGPSGQSHSRKGPERGARVLGPITTPAPDRVEGYGRSQPTTLQLSETPPNDLSPHTVESNNAPSLVSDSDDDEYETGNGTSAPSSEGEDEEDEDRIDVNFEVEDISRERGGHVEPGMSMPGKSHDPELSTSRKAKVAQRGGFRGRGRGTTKKRGGR